MSKAAAVRRIVDAKPAYVGITLFTVGVYNAAEIARGVKKWLPNVKVIVGGPHISSMGMETMQRFGEFDIAVLNEGERVLEELLPVLDEGKQPVQVQVKGILYRVENHVFQAPPAPVIDDLDALPMPAWDLLPGFPAAYLPAIYDYPRGPVATIAASRGCPFACRFCDTSTFGAKVRAYTPRAVFAMMKYLRETYGIRHVLFVDDLFLASGLRTLELCNLIIDNRLDMTWTCTARVDTVKPDVLKRMRQAGCWEISFGLETGSQDLLRKMDKAANVETAENAVNWTHRAGIRCKGLFMLGYPGEDRETIAKTKAFVGRLPMTTMNLSKFTPYPGSPIYKTLYGTSIRDEDWKRMNGMNFVWAPEGFTVEELDRAYQDILLSFYQRRQVVHKYIAMSVRYPRHLLRLAQFGSGYFTAKTASFLEGRGGWLVRLDAPDLRADAD
ncbi:MAG: radical SAM protein [Pseudomonadota bacterium]